MKQNDQELALLNAIKEIATEEQYKECVQLTKTLVGVKRLLSDKTFQLLTAPLTIPESFK